MAGGYRTPSGDGLDVLVRRLEKMEQRLAEVEAPSGTAIYGTSSMAGSTHGQLQQTVNYLQGLTTTVNVAGNFSQSSANDAVFRWYAPAAPDPTIVDLPVSTGRALVTATAGEVQLNPSGGFLQGLVGYTVKDSLGATVPGGALATAQRYGRIYADREMNIGIRTPEVPIELDPDLNPGPYTFAVFFGTWVSAANAGACSFTFNDLSLRVEVLSTGVMP